MRIKQKILFSFLFILFSSLSISLWFNFVVQQKVVQTFQTVGANALPGVIAVSRMTTDLYRTLILLEEYEHTQSKESLKNIEQSLSSLAENATTHKMYQIDIAKGFGVKSGLNFEEKIQKFSRLITQYLIMIKKQSHTDDLQQHRKKINQAVESFIYITEPRIESDISRSFQSINDIKNLHVQSYYLYFISSLGILILSIILSIFIAHQLSKPLQKLNAFAKKIATGQLEHELTIHSKDEIGELSRSFNHMSQSLAIMHKELILSNKKLEQEKILAEQANEAKSNFLAIMSHEMRTPMNAIRGMTHLALKTELNDKQRNYLQKATIATDRLQALITDILDFSDIESGNLIIEEIHFSLESVLQKLTESIQPDIDKKSLDFNLHLDESLPGKLSGDPERLEKILLNLVDNAIKFSDSGGKVVIDITASENINKEPLIQFAVSDNGIGIEPAQLERLFDMFTQADESSTREYGGAGLGLAMCKKLVEMMHGKLWVESKSGKGSTFYFAIPLKS